MKPRDQHCPRCSGSPGKPCVDEDGKVLEYYHQGRIYLAVMASVEKKGGTTS